MPSSLGITTEAKMYLHPKPNHFALNKRRMQVSSKQRLESLQQLGQITTIQVNQAKRKLALPPNKSPYRSRRIYRPILKHFKRWSLWDWVLVPTTIGMLVVLIRLVK